MAYGKQAKRHERQQRCDGKQKEQYVRRYTHNVTGRGGSGEDGRIPDLLLLAIEDATVLRLEPHVERPAKDDGAQQGDDDKHLAFAERAGEQARPNAAPDTPPRACSARALTVHGTAPLIVSRAKKMSPLTLTVVAGCMPSAAASAASAIVHDPRESALHFFLSAGSN